MTKTTKAQRHALKRIAERDGSPYRLIRRRAQPTIGCDGAIVVRWGSMWLCIEADGYTHS